MDVQPTVQETGPIKGPGATTALRFELPFTIFEIAEMAAGKYPCSLLSPLLLWTVPLNISTEEKGGVGGVSVDLCNNHSST